MKTINFIFLLFLFTSLYSQDKDEQSINNRPKNGFLLNVGGTDIIGFSLQYEYNHFLSNNAFLSFGTGVSKSKEIFSNDDIYGVPYHATINYGKKRLFGEFGLTGNFYYFRDIEAYPLQLHIGFRFYPLNKNKIYFKIYGITFFNNEEALILPGIHLGFAF